MRGVGSARLSRRRALWLGSGMAIGPLAAIAESEVNSSLTAVPGLRVGHWTHPSGSTGCTVVLADGGAVGGVDVRGGAPGTRETDLLRPEMSVDSVHAVVLSGGSAYGLAAADGVMQYLEGEGVGFPAGGSVVPIVPAAILFDLGIGDPKARPTAKSGLAAARNASRQPVPMGSAGAGAGATVGKLFGPGRAMRGGLGSAAITRPDGLVVGAIAAVNALGDVVDPATGQIVAGARTADGSGFADSMAHLRSGRRAQASGTGQNTTIALVAANVTWTKTQAAKTAQMAHDGLAMAIRPAHMPFDGDTVFALATGGRTVDARMLGEIGALAADMLAQAVVAAVRTAESGFGLPASKDL